VPQLISIKTIQDSRGALSVAQGELPFVPARVFFVHGMTAQRGGHRHRANRVLLFACGGKIRVGVESPGVKTEFLLVDPKEGLLLEPEDWHVFEALDPAAVLVVLCSHPYDPQDYITERYE
jgi:dTDP-4-dehydrorhamnose 3,5-epimerase-like enzyme